LWYWRIGWSYGTQVSARCSASSEAYSCRACGAGDSETRADLERGAPVHRRLEEHGHGYASGGIVPEQAECRLNAPFRAHSSSAGDRVMTLAE
jgi:hypothetical protein